MKKIELSRLPPSTFEHFMEVHDLTLVVTRWTDSKGHNRVQGTIRDNRGRWAYYSDYSYGGGGDFARLEECSHSYAGMILLISEAISAEYLYFGFLWLTKIKVPTLRCY